MALTITSVTIGPRAPEQLEDAIAAADLVLEDDLLDAVDAIVPPGTEVNPADTYLGTPPSLTESGQRRRGA